MPCSDPNRLPHLRERGFSFLERCLCACVLFSLRSASGYYFLEAMKAASYRPRVTFQSLYMVTVFALLL